jgi:hypothetical protein
MSPNLILPYPFQLPQDIALKNAPPALTPTPPTPPETVVTPPPVDTGGASNYGGIWYGPTPPNNPLYGWLWTAGSGSLYVYIEPGIWQQVATNW